MNWIFVIMAVLLLSLFSLIGFIMWCLWKDRQTSMEGQERDDYPE